MLIAKAETDNAIEIFRRALTKSEPVIFSTDTIYGVGAPIKDIVANKKIFELKGRDSSKPFPVLIADDAQLSQLAVIETDLQAEIIKHVWPGRITLILKAAEGIHPLFTSNGTIAVRMPDKKWLRNLIYTAGPLSATSANPAGVEYTADISSIIRSFPSVGYYVLDNNSDVLSSTIIDVSGEAPILIRKGDNYVYLQNLIKKINFSH
jgi:L-threonylcarbamoyladenylate synthase